MMFGFFRKASRTTSQDQSSEPTGPRFDGLPPKFHTEYRSIGKMQVLHVQGAVDVYVRRGDRPTLVVAAERKEDILRVLTTLQGDTTLEVSVESVGGIHIVGGGFSIHGDISINGRVVGAAGTGRVAVGIELPELREVVIQGSGDVRLMDLQQSSLDVQIRGSGDVLVSGNVKRLEATVRGSGDIRARGLRSQTAMLQVTGSGDIEALVFQEVDAQVRGSGDIRIFGQPQRWNTKKLGSGEIEFY